ncbi:MAG: hypothetical protein JSS82_00245 [Bacteroidetes bacterium]|nr:hypothetical protein [Bacteroidota bacterium]
MPRTKNQVIDFLKNYFPTCTVFDFAIDSDYAHAVPLHTYTNSIFLGPKKDVGRDGCIWPLSTPWGGINLQLYFGDCVVRRCQSHATAAFHFMDIGVPSLDTIETATDVLRKLMPFMTVSMDASQNEYPDPQLTEFSRCAA